MLVCALLAAILHVGVNQNFDKNVSVIHEAGDETFVTGFMFYQSQLFKTAQLNTADPFPPDQYRCTAEFPVHWYD